MGMRDKGDKLKCGKHSVFKGGFDSASLSWAIVFGAALVIVTGLIV